MNLTPSAICTVSLSPLWKPNHFSATTNISPSNSTTSMKYYKEWCDTTGRNYMYAHYTCTHSIPLKISLPRTSVCYDNILSVTCDMHTDIHVHVKPQQLMLFGNALVDKHWECTTNQPNQQQLHLLRINTFWHSSSFGRTLTSFSHSHH